MLSAWLLAAVTGGVPFQLLGAVDAPRFDGNAEVTPPLTVQDAEVALAVAELMQRYRVPVRMNGDVEGKVSGRFADVAASAVLDHLGALHGFYWYFDGSFLEIGPAMEVEVEIFRIPPSQIDRFLSDIDSAGLIFSQFPLNVNRSTGMILARGPESLRNVLKTIAGQHHETAAPAMTVIHGRNAPAPQ